MSSTAWCALLFQGEHDYPYFRDEGTSHHNCEKIYPGPYRSSVTRLCSPSAWKPASDKTGEAKLGQTAKGKKREDDRSKSSWISSRFGPQEKKCTAVHPDEKILPTTSLLTWLLFSGIFWKREEGIRPISPRGTSGPLGGHGRGKAPYRQHQGLGEESPFLPGCKSGSWARGGGLCCSPPYTPVSHHGSPPQ